MEGKKTIVIVDDDPDVVTIVKGILHNSEYRVESVSSGRALFAHLQKSRPDLIILDIKMPEMDGFEVLKRLKATPGASSIPVILLTGRGEYHDALAGYRLGADYFMSKPFTGMQLLNGIHLFLEQEESQKVVAPSFH